MRPALQAQWYLKSNRRVKKSQSAQPAKRSRKMLILQKFNADSAQLYMSRCVGILIITAAPESRQDRLAVGRHTLLTRCDVGDFVLQWGPHCVKVGRRLQAGGFLLHSNAASREPICVALRCVALSRVDGLTSLPRPLKISRTLSKACAQAFWRASSKSSCGV